MLYLIVYDISDNRICHKVAKRLLAEGFERIQLSVFLGLFNPRRKDALWEQLNAWISEEKGAKFYVLPITKKSFKSMDVIGDLDVDIDYLAGDKHTLFV